MHQEKTSFWSNFIPKSWLLLSKNYSLDYFKGDLIAGITVGVVALPLAMAFSIAAGLTPERGLYTAIIAGFLISLLGGSRFQIGGPTGAFVVIIYDIVQRSGYDGLVIVTILAGIILVISALARLGNLIKYVPYPLITGFTTGIAVIIFSSQVKDFLGLKIQNLPADFIQKWKVLFSALPTFDPSTFLVALGTLLLILLIRRFLPVMPWGITAVAISTVITWGFHLPVETIATRFGEIQRSFPVPSFPDFSLLITNIRDFIPDALTVAFLAGIESLLSAVVADGMTGTTHKANCELMAQGIANTSSVIFGGIPATGAIARTATNVKSGAKTPLAGMIHSLTLLAILLVLAPVVSQIPLAALSAVLVMVSWNMSEAKHFFHIFKAPSGDIAILLVTFLLTVFVDLTVAVSVGVILAAFIFIKRMGEISGVYSFLDQENGSEEDKETEEIETLNKKGVSPEIEIYEINGPFFFGVANSLKGILSNFESPPKVFILRMRRLQLLDASGMHSLIEFYDQCKREGTMLLLSEVNKNFLTDLTKFGVIKLIGPERIFSSLDAALIQAKKFGAS